MTSIPLNGLVPLPVWGYVLVALALTHVTIVAVTIYLHRCQSHRAVELGAIPSHFFRAWLWLTTGMNTKEWAAVHRKHHAFVDQTEDPHSPQVEGLNKVLWEGVELYWAERENRYTIDKYGHGTPEDWLERHVYGVHPNIGISVMLALDLLAFGPLGLTIWAVQMVWIPFFAAGVVNGVGHSAGYRNYESPDASTNIMPWGILIGGEELHNNHHAFASSAKFSAKWWELDLGWVYIRLLQALRLARVKKIAPRLYRRVEKPGVDLDTVRAVIGNRLQVMADYAQEVVSKVHKEEIAKAGGQTRAVLKSTRRLLYRESSLLDDEARGRLEAVLRQSRALDEVYRFRLRLQGIWSERTATPEALLEALQEWCREAQETGVQALAEFAGQIRGYSQQA
jgi:stearoyl-CoA desaturase (delta-9 desaturase)